MGSTHKWSKLVDAGSQHSTVDESDSESGMEYSSKRMKQDFIDEDDYGSGESPSEGKMEEEEEDNDDDNEGSYAKQNGKRLDGEMDELVKQYQNLRSEEQNLMENLKRQKDEDAIKGQAVMNQKVLWDKILELRFLLQKIFSSSNKLPQEPVRSSFCNSARDIDQAYLDLISFSKDTLSTILDLQEALFEKNSSIPQGPNGKDLESCINDDEEWLQISNMHSRLVPFRNSSIDKWHRKTQVTSGVAAFRGRLQAFNQNISEQVAGFMRDPNRMIKRMQLMRSSVGVFGQISEVSEIETVKEEDGIIDGDPDLIEDSEFYSQLLKEFLESNITSSETAYYALRKLQPKKRKVVDRRASKSRKIRYHVHEKIVNFMAPVPMCLPAMGPKLFENLFGRSIQNSAPPTT